MDVDVFHFDAVVQMCLPVGLNPSARTLERILRRTLYRRTALGYSAAPAGVELARGLKLALREIEYGIEEVRAEHGLFVSRIVVGNIPHSDIHLLSAATNDVLAKFPDASVEILDGHYHDLLKPMVLSSSTSRRETGQSVGHAEHGSVYSD
jgi:DNA-binding transcriptional LysR family regulator